eukprot:COSAG01_NODE_29928_length_626_cov_10.447818_1_plen_104_part_10
MSPRQRHPSLAAEAHLNGAADAVGGGGGGRAPSSKKKKGVKKKHVLTGLPRRGASAAEAAVESLLQHRKLSASASPRRRDEGEWALDAEHMSCGECARPFGLLR